MALGPDQITAINFKEFYARILPYLNGAGANDYSTEEKIVGSWIDGKPVYQKTITGLNINMVWADAYFLISSEISPLIPNVKKILKLWGTLIGAAGSVEQDAPLGVGIGTNGNWQFRTASCYVSDTTAGININTLTIQYTKTTD